MNRRVLPLIIGSLLLQLGCGGNDEPTGPTGPSFSTLSITTASLPNAVPSVAYSQTLVAIGGDGSYTWALSGGTLLPTGLSLFTNGAIWGRPTGASSTFTVEVASGDGQTAQQALAIDMEVTLLILTASLPNAAPTVAYSETLSATGGDGSYTWSLTVGSLPTGLSLNSSTGLISGTPTGFNSRFTIQVASGDGQTATQELTLIVDPWCSAQPATAVVTFEDAMLENWIRAALSVGAQEPLTCGLVSGLTSLSAREAGIVSLVGIQNLTNLTSLDLRLNLIEDISPLSGLTSLRELLVSSNSITDISPLSGLTSLRELLVSSNSFTDISPLSGLMSLTTLDLDRNSITDISALSGLTSLTRLDLHENPDLTDIQPLLANTGLGAGDFVDLINTNVSCTDVALLQAKAMRVSSDCP